MSYVWVPRVQIMEPRDPIAIGVRCKGQFSDFVITRADGTRVVLPGVSANLILNTGLDHIGNWPASPSDRCAIGTGTATPQVTDTGLTSPVWTSSQQATGGSYIAGPPVKRRWYVTYRFPIGSLNGNYSEIGIGPTQNGTLFSRALIVDGNGTPTTITVTSAESLDVTYTLDEIVATGDTAFSVNISGTTYTGFTRRIRAASAAVYPIVTHRPWAVTSNGGWVYTYTGTLPAFDSGSAPSGYIGNASSASNPAYVNGSYSRGLSLQFGQNNSNGNIKSIAVPADDISNFYGFGYGIQFDTPLPKDGSKVLTLNITVSWGRSA